VRRADSGRQFMFYRWATDDRDHNHGGYLSEGRSLAGTSLAPETDDT
jgi:hypothetical protein